MTSAEKAMREVFKNVEECNPIRESVERLEHLIKDVKIDLMEMERELEQARLDLADDIQYRKWEADSGVTSRTLRITL